MARNQLNRTNRVSRANFTINNPSDYQREWFSGICGGTESLIEYNIEFLIYQEEKAPTTGTIHFQGYVEFIKKVRPVGVKHRKKKEWEHTNWYKADNPRASIKYASKNETRLVGGQSGKAGRARKGREDTILDVIEHFKEEKDVRKVAKAHPLVDFLHHDKLVRYGMANRQRSECNVIMLIGASGVGKSRWAKKMAEASGSVYTVPAKTRHNGRWDWQMYTGQKTIIINEWDDSWLPPLEFKLFFDWDKFQLEKKHGCMWLISDYMILTSNKDIKDWYRKWRSDPDNDPEPLERRITDYFTIYDCTKNPEYDDEYEEDADNSYMLLTERKDPEGGFRFANPDEYGLNFNRDEQAGHRINKKRKRDYEHDPEEEERSRIPLILKTCRPLIPV